MFHVKQFTPRYSEREPKKKCETFKESNRETLVIGKPVNKGETRYCGPIYKGKLCLRSIIKKVDISLI